MDVSFYLRYISAQARIHKTFQFINRLTGHVKEFLQYNIGAKILVLYCNYRERETFYANIFALLPNVSHISNQYGRPLKVNNIEKMFI